MIVGSVSVVICAWNNWPDLEMTIASALHQSLPPLEVIVVDNSSTDETSMEVARRFGHRVRYLCQPNLGCAGAYNTGFAIASGEFIQFIAGDDILAPNKLEKQLEVFRAKPELEHPDVWRYPNVSDFARSRELVGFSDAARGRHVGRAPSSRETRRWN